MQVGKPIDSSVLEAWQLSQSVKVKGGVNSSKQLVPPTYPSLTQRVTATDRRKALTANAYVVLMRFSQLRSDTIIWT